MRNNRFSGCQILHNSECQFPPFYCRIYSSLVLVVKMCKLWSWAVFIAVAVVRTVGFTGVYILWEHTDVIGLKHGRFYETGNVVFFILSWLIGVSVVSMLWRFRYLWLITEAKAEFVHRGLPFDESNYQGIGFILDYKSGLWLSSGILVWSKLRLCEDVITAEMLFPVLLFTVDLFS